MRTRSWHIVQWGVALGKHDVDVSQVVFHEPCEGCPCGACLTVATRAPAATRIGMRRSIRVVLPTPDGPTNETTKGSGDTGSSYPSTWMRGQHATVDGQCHSSIGPRRVSRSAISPASSRRAVTTPEPSRQLKQRAGSDPSVAAVGSVHDEQVVSLPL